MSGSLAAAAAVAGLVLAGCGGTIDETGGNVSSAGSALSSKCAPAVPSPTLAVPEGNKLAFSFDARGVQIYTCGATAAGGFAWSAAVPEATLFNNGGQVAGTHFAGPSWQANDGSKVVGARVAAFTVDATAIPWLLLRAASNEGDGRMAKVTFIQRLDTVGGLTPAASSCDAASVGTAARINYSATYFFFEARQGNSDGPNCN